MTAGVEVDTSGLERDMAQLAAGLAVQSKTVTAAQANAVAATVRAAIPVRTGRLRSTVRVESSADSAEVHYGGTLPYAAYIDRRTGATTTAVTGADVAFVAAMRAAAATQVGRI